MKKLERLNSDKFASYALEAESMFSIVGATPPGVDGGGGGGGTYSGGTTYKQVATTCNLGYSHSGADTSTDQEPQDIDPDKEVAEPG